jgi:uncharacterized protein (TIGR00299 family) protein
LAGLHLQGFDLQTLQVQKGALRAVKVDVIVTDPSTKRRLPDILSILQKSDLPEKIIAQASEIFTRLGSVEARIHGLELKHVHLHELGGLDTIVDIVGVLHGIEALGLQKVYCSPVPLGAGFTHSQHGPLPVPAPATLALLEGVPVVGRETDQELVTPTGAALLTSLATEFGPIPPMRLLSLGYGAGGRDLPTPNVLRLLIGEQATPATGNTQALSTLETNIDDLNPEFYDYLLERLFQAGALDVALSPLHMKKNRPATQVQVLCLPQDADHLAGILFAETSTLGIRKQLIERLALDRETIRVDTPYGIMRVKVARWTDRRYKLAPEYDDCRAAARKHGVPIREVYRVVERIAEENLPKP